MKKLVVATIVTAIVFLFAARCPTWADDAKGKITLREAQALARALGQLDKFEFGDGKVRMRLVNDLTIAATADVTIEKTRQAIVKEILKNSGVTEIKTGTPEYEDFITQMTQALDQPAPGTQDLAHVKASELKLDKNEIPITVLAAMKPILDVDQ